ncbi:histone-lysine N-methyltransferase, H3 lysine-9 specific SUVH4 [Rhodamnia argentea]|uniref:Histone-lysine N-methyltransferase, H3 lysine-9 specific SUVH4 n=1 Tax=Rhodamnia argentea TaxID=178133 RepID=A0A8B8PXE6_9MYRT|nr:histone-lysine N-methyltransferase, H3 lysine-9 specific SUVH4 [Rhodamnia argentea]XP_030539456.2 histone-lysine N-methyltransferase, H3 lysine-9 specific SUVH4 [Rhodamnia argentea]
MVVPSLQCMDSLSSDELKANGSEVVASSAGRGKSPKSEGKEEGPGGGKREKEKEKEKEKAKKGGEPECCSPRPPGTQRRCSARIQTKQRAEKELLVRRRVELLDNGDGVTSTGKRRNVGGRGKSGGESAGKEGPEVEESEVEAVGGAEIVGISVEPASAGSGVQRESQVAAGGDNVAPMVEKSDFAKVKETLRLFNKHYLHFVQEEEKRCNKEKAENSKGSQKPKSKSKSKEQQKGSKQSKTNSKKGNSTGDTKKLAMRPDLKAITKMLETNGVLHPKKRFGNIPGINVGHQFYSRAEMVVVGFHSHWLNGIDYMGQAYRKEYSNYTFPVAVAIVLSGMYEDDQDNADDVVYTGQGGHNLTGDKRQIRDQVLERGNLALKNCIDQNVPVRVIRGHESRTSYCGKVYTYDGLYKVVTYWAEKGISGYTVFKFRLRRMPGQPMLTTNQVQFVYGRVPNSVSEIRGLVCKDITGGEEAIPIPATNLVDDPPVPPSGFTYIKTIQVSKNIILPAASTGCKCRGGCIDPRICLCATLNGSDFPYVQRDGGRLIEAKDVVYECGPNCGCGPDCVNRVSQRGIKYRLEVFRAPRKGWAVRSWDFIPSGAPVCEYIGILNRAEDMDNASENNFIFDIDCLQTMRGLGGRERRSRDASSETVDHMGKHDDQKSEIPEYCIDAGSVGNIARFINHSCEPNLFVQCVLSSHQDIKLARVVLFAADNIPPLQELTYDYGYALDSVFGPDGKVKRMPCYCGAADCRKRLF